MIGTPYCYQCQRPIHGEEAFCRHCGTRLRDTGLQPGQRIGGHYIVQSVIGQGGMGQVVRAMHELTNQIVAIKTLSPHLASDPGLRERFLQEARALAGLDHPNIMTLHNFLEDDDKLFLVMQYIDGQDLDAMFRRCGGLSAPATVPIFYEALKGLGYAHRQGIIHRDLKPANILITRDGRVKLTDFGIARIIGGLRLTMTGAQVGTVFYMAPEQIQGIEAEPRSDIYAMGVSLYEVLTGRLPFDGDDYTVRKGHVESLPPDPRRWRSQLDQSLVDNIMRALAKDPRERFQTAEAFADALGRRDEVLPLIECPLCGSQHPIGEGVSCPSCNKEELCRFHMIAGEGICQPCFQLDNRNPTMPLETLMDIQPIKDIEHHAAPSAHPAEGEDFSAPYAEDASSIRQTPHSASAESLVHSYPDNPQYALEAAHRQPSKISEAPVSGLLGASAPISSAPAYSLVDNVLQATPSSHTLPPHIVTRDGAEMVLVPGGSFVLGAPGEPNAQPTRQIQIKPIYIDRTPVTNACYLRFVRETGHPAPAHWWDPTEHNGQHFPPDLTLCPVVQVSYDDALSYCRWVGKRLPTETEWEKTARGTDQRLYPWGDSWQDGMAHFGEPQICSVLRYAHGQSPYGACDMLGNVWEWIEDFYASDSYQHLEDQDPQITTESSFRVVRGGSHRDPPANIRATTRGFRMPHLKGPSVGFRCVLDIQERHSF